MVVIGCSGSTGSSLLKTILNRHSQIFAGPEAALFAFPQVYDNWAVCKKKLLKGIKNEDWQLRKGMILLQPEFGWERQELEQMIAVSNSFQSFVKAFFDKPLKQTGKTNWIAKTPANAIGMAPFLAHFPAGKVIQTIRNPYDTIASLMARGINVYAATAYYVYNTAAATSNRGNQRYYEIRYEDLVANPRSIIKNLLSFLELPFESEILVAKHEKRAEPTAMKGWKHEETAAVKTSSIGRFQELEVAQKELIKAAFSAFYISKSYQQKRAIKYADGAKLCEVLGYEYLPGDTVKYSFLLKKYRWRDQLSRVKHGFYGQFSDYPGQLKALKITS